MNTVTVSFDVKLTAVDCYKCGVIFGLPKDFNDNRLANGGEFYCPNGHSQIYTKPHVKILEEQLFEAQKKARELQCSLLQEQDARVQAEKHLSRVKNGVCPCCKRHFTNLERHIKTKHPEFRKK